MQTRYISIRQLSELIPGISIKTLRNWTSSRKIPSHKFNGKVLYKESEILSLIQKRESIEEKSEKLLPEKLQKIGI